MLFHNVVVKVANRAFRHNRAAVHDVESIPDVETEVEVLFDQEDSDPAFRAEFPDGL